MSTWYYADAERQRQGPLTAEELVKRFHSGQLRLDTLVWRDGMADWQPLRDFSAELALHQPPAETFYTPAEPAVSPVGGNLYATTPVDSPYAPPTAALNAAPHVVHGGDVVFSGFWKRVAASFLDGIVTAVLTYAVLIPMMLLMGMSASQMAASSSNPLMGGMSVMMALMIYPVSFGIPAVYFAWMHASSRQASLGKMAVEAKVVRGDGSPIGFWRGFLRYLAYFLFTLLTCGLGVLISGLMVAFTERKQALHDLLCDTLVVDKWAFTEHPEWQKRELGTVTVVILVFLGVVLLGSIALMAVGLGTLAAAGNLR